MNFAADPVQTEIPQFTDLGFWTINVLRESSGLRTPSTIIQRPTYGANRSAPNRDIGELAAVGVSEVKSDYTITIKLSFKFGRRISNLSCNCFGELTTIGLDSYWHKHDKCKKSHLDLTPVGTKTPDPKTITLPTELSKRKEKA